MKHQFLIFLIIIGCARFQAQTDQELVNTTISKNKIESHIGFLASDELRGRETGSPEIDIAASYLANTLHRYGVKPVNGSFYQQVGLEKTTAPIKIGVQLNGLVTETAFALRGQNTQLNATALYLNYGLEEDYKGRDVKDKLLVVLAGTPENQDIRTSLRTGSKKRDLAKEHGALGLIELSTADFEAWSRYANFFNREKLGLTEQEENTELHLWLHDKDGNLKKQVEKSKNIDISVVIEGITKTPVAARNVVGMVEGTDTKLKDEFVIYSAHYDHVGVGKPNAENDSIYNGARDNAVGTVTVLSAAENIAKYPTKRSALFILFTGEEKGLLGSKWYVENPLIPLDKMVYCFNSDNGGYNDTSKTTIIGLGRTTVGKHIIEASKTFGLEAIDDPSPEEGLFDRSDNVHFAAKGIPAPTFSLGFTAFDAEINKYYHQVTDNPDTLDYNYLVKFFKAYVLSCRMIANDPETPFWIKGDKYYNAGTALYKIEKIKQ